MSKEFEKLYPLQFEPVYKYRIWGGNKLRNVLGKVYEGEQIGESWEISDVKGDETLVSNGPLKGKSLQALAQRFGSDLLGSKVYQSYGEQFPLLIKFIDSATPLSVQVHPHDEIAKERHDSFGKNEMWYIMDADEQAEIIVGFNKELDRSSYQECLENNSILDVLNVTGTKEGDVFYIPTGRVHAIGAGVLLAEIQQTSDVTYRIYDYDRVDKITGKKRDLHNDLAIDVIDFELKDSYTTDYSSLPETSNEIIETPYFNTNLIIVEHGFQQDYKALDSFVILIGVKGSCTFEVAGVSYQIKKGSTFLLPAAINTVKFSAAERCEILEVSCG